MDKPLIPFHPKDYQYPEAIRNCSPEIRFAYIELLAPVTDPLPGDLEIE